MRVWVESCSVAFGQSRRVVSVQGPSRQSAFRYVRHGMAVWLCLAWFVCGTARWVLIVWIFYIMAVSFGLVSKRMV